MKRLNITLSFYFISFAFTSAQVNFIDVSSQVGLPQIGLNYGVAIADFNNDSFDDIFATRILAGGVLYQNLGDGSFLDVTSSAAITTAPTAQFAVWGDLNNDGWLDLFIGARDEPNALYISNQNGTFTEIAQAAGVSAGTKVKSVMLADVDKDGWLDIYVARLGLQNILYKNNGSSSGANVSFTDFTFASGATDPMISMGAVFFDYDNDGDPDLYLTHDANIPNILYRNNGNGTFIDVSLISGTNIAAQGMGVDAGDINNDGWLDLYITNLGANVLLLNNGNGTFSNISMSAGVTDLGMGWGCSFFDFDNDGWQDIYIANDSYFSPYPNLLYHNNGNNTFSVVSQNSPLHSMEGGYGLGCFDYDNDGWLDIYLANYGGNIGNQLFKNNENNNNNWLKIKLYGEESNATGIGGRVQLNVGDKLLTDEVNGGSGWASQNSLVQHFGLGTADLVDLVIIKWPSGTIDSFENIAVNQLLEVTEGESKIVIVDPEPNPDPDTLAWIIPSKSQVLQPTEQTSLTEEQGGNVIKVSLFPNPTSQFFQIQIDKEIGEIYSVFTSVTDAAGHPIDLQFLTHNSAELFTIKADCSGLPSGSYFVKVVFGNRIWNQMLMKI